MSAPSKLNLLKETKSQLNDSYINYLFFLSWRPNEDVEWEIAERGLEGDCLWWKPLRINFLAECAEFRIRAANSEGFGAYAYSKHHSGIILEIYSSFYFSKFIENTRHFVF